VAKINAVRAHLPDRQRNNGHRRTRGEDGGSIANALSVSNLAARLLRSVWAYASKITLEADGQRTALVAPGRLAASTDTAFWI